METWLLFSLGLLRFESGKWIWHPVSDMTLRIVFPPFPIICEWSVYETSIFIVTRRVLVSKYSMIMVLASTTPSSEPPIRICGSENDNHSVCMLPKHPNLQWVQKKTLHYLILKFDFFSRISPEPHELQKSYLNLFISLSEELSDEKEFFKSGHKISWYFQKHCFVRKK